MSWLSGLASKTENLLNSLDQSAATALTKAKTSNGSSSKQSFRYDAESAAPMSVPSPRASVPPPARSPSHVGGGQTVRPARPDPEEQLIAFLNDSSTPARPSSGHSRQSSVSSVVSVGNFLSVASGQESTAAPPPPGPSHTAAAADTAISIPSGAGVASGVQNGNHSETEQLRMLQKEITNLNREMAQLLQRAKLSEKECTKLKYQLSTSSSQLAETERQCRHLQQRDADLQESLKAKDGQLALLKVRLDEADGELRSRQAAVDRLQLQNDRILQSSSDTSGQQSGTIQGLQDRLHEAEARIRQEQHALTAAQQSHDQRTEQLTSEREALTAALTSARQQLQHQQTSAAELQRQLADSRTGAQAAAAELADYKLKAQRILQSKDQLISRLKEGGGSDGDAGDLAQAELEQVRSERELAQTEVHKLSARVQQLREELQHAETAALEETQAAGEALSEAETREASEARLRHELERELESAQQELRYMREDMVQQKTQALTRLQERDVEIEKLRRQITSKHVASSTEVELETRLRSLTEALIQKQTNIESLSTQNKSLQLQLERSQRQVHELEGCAPPAAERVALLGDASGGDSVRLRTPAFLTESPWDSGVTRRVKRAYSTLDACSVRMGVFLKRYPIARIFVLGYMCLLHLWVMVVLFTYTPEIHGADFHRTMSPLP